MLHKTLEIITIILLVFLLTSLKWAVIPSIILIAGITFIYHLYRILK